MGFNMYETNEKHEKIKSNNKSSIFLCKRKKFEQAKTLKKLAILPKCFKKWSPPSDDRNYYVKEAEKLECFKKYFYPAWREHQALKKHVPAVFGQKQKKKALK